MVLEWKLAGACSQLARNSEGLSVTGQVGEGQTSHREEKKEEETLLWYETSLDLTEGSA
jgi:hypothetical protein